MNESASRHDQLKEQVRREWLEGAPAWKRWQPKWQEQSRAATELIVRAARPAKGARVLDLASGSGEPALTLAEAVGPAGEVIATDLVPEMMEPIEDAARGRGLANLRTQAADMEALPFADESFDVVTARFAVVFCPRIDRALAEMRRVLRPGGRAAVVVWGPRDQPFFKVTAGVFLKYVAPPKPQPGEPNPFCFAEAGTLTSALRHAGFRTAEEKLEELPWTWPGDAEENWRARREISAPLFHKIFDALPRERHAEVNAEIVAALRHYERDGRVNTPVRVVCAVAER